MRPGNSLPQEEFQPTTLPCGMAPAGLRLDQELTATFLRSPCREAIYTRAVISPRPEDRARCTLQNGMEAPGRHWEQAQMTLFSPWLRMAPMCTLEAILEQPAIPLPATLPDGMDRTGVHLDREWTIRCLLSHLMGLTCMPAAILRTL